MEARSPEFSSLIWKSENGLWQAEFWVLLQETFVLRQQYQGVRIGGKGALVRVTKPWMAPLFTPLIADG